MDDIRSGYDGFRVTKETSDRFSSFHGEQKLHCKATSKKYKAMKNIFYVFDEGRLYRKWYSKNKCFSEEVLYVHLQKRAMSCPDNYMAPSKFTIVSDQFMDGISDNKMNNSPLISWNNLYLTFRGNVKLLLLTIKDFFNND